MRKIFDSPLANHFSPVMQSCQGVHEKDRCAQTVSVTLAAAYLVGTGKNHRAGRVDP